MSGWGDDIALPPNSFERRLEALVLQLRDDAQAGRQPDQDWSERIGGKIITVVGHQAGGENSKAILRTLAKLPESG